MINNIVLGQVGTRHMMLGHKISISNITYTVNNRVKDKWLTCSGYKVPHPSMCASLSTTTPVVATDLLVTTGEPILVLSCF
jgi:hypothetical protein